jgi:hypothetical protein
MELRFRITIDAPESETPNVRRFFIALAAEVVRAAAHIDGNPPADRAMEAVADVLAEIKRTHRL